MYLKGAVNQGKFNNISGNDLKSHQSFIQNKSVKKGTHFFFYFTTEACKFYYKASCPIKRECKLNQEIEKLAHEYN